MGDTRRSKAWLLAASLVLAWGPAPAADQAPPGGWGDGRERAALELLNTAKDAPVAPGPAGITRGRMGVFRAVIDQYPETLAACRARVSLAHAIVLVYQESRERHALGWSSPEGREVLEQAISLCEEALTVLQSGPPDAEGVPSWLGPVHLRGMAASFAGTYCTLLQQPEREVQFRLRVVREAPGTPFVQKAVLSLGWLYQHLGDVEESRRWWERALNDYPDLPHWESLVDGLRYDYVETEPRRLELAAGLCALALTRPEAIKDERVRETIQGTIPWAERTTMRADPAERVAQYLRLWQSGYYAYMLTYLTEGARKGMTGEAFAAWLHELAEKGVQLTKFEVLEATQSQDGTTARVPATLQFERDLAPDLVSGPVTFDLASQQWPYPGKQRMWLIQKGLPVP